MWDAKKSDLKKSVIFLKFDNCVCLTYNILKLPTPFGVLNLEKSIL